MEGRGKKSSASLSVLPTPLVQRLDAPEGLSTSQGAIWAGIVETKPADWFSSDNAPLLAEYVRAVDMCNLLAMQIEAAVTGGEPGELKAALDMRDKESKRVASLATKLRLTNQSRYTPQAAATANKNNGTAAKPWRFGKE